MKYFFGNNHESEKNIATRQHCLTQTRMLRAHYRETPKLQAGISKKGKDKMEEGKNK